MQKLSEIDLCKKLIIYLEAQGWTIYQEVPLSCGTCDIIATKKISPFVTLAWIIEAKKSFSFDVIAQANERKNSAHYVSIFTPHRKSKASKWLVVDFLKYLGIGYIELNYNNIDIKELIPPKLNRKANYKKTLASLDEKHKTFCPAGSPSPKTWTPFKAFCESIENEVKKSPGILLKDLISKINHKYSSQAGAIASIKFYSKEGIMKIKIIKENKKLRAYPYTNI